MPILTPPPSKPQRGIRATFAALMDGFITWLVDTFYPEMVALVAAISALVAGGASKIPFKVDLGTTMADPGVGWLRLNSATQNAATAMVVDVIGSDNVDYTNLLYTFDDSTSTVLGQIRVEKMGDASKFLVFNLLAMTTPTGYRQLTLTCIGYSTANPFAQADPVVLSFTRTGDKGDTGATGAGGATNLLGTATVGAAVANIDFLSLFSDTYDKYTIEIQGVVPSTGDTLCMRLAFGGAADTSANYLAAVGNGSSSASASSSFQITGSQVGVSGNPHSTFTVEIRNARSTVKPKALGVRGSYWNAVGSQNIAVAAEGASLNTTAVSGFRLYWSSGSNFTSGTVRVYGHRTS